MRSTLNVNSTCGQVFGQSGSRTERVCMDVRHSCEVLDRMYVRPEKIFIFIHSNRNVNHCQSLGSMQGFNLALLSIIHRGVDLRRKQSSHLVQVLTASNDGPEAADASAVKGSAKISAHLVILPCCIIAL